MNTCCQTLSVLVSLEDITTRKKSLFYLLFYLIQVFLFLSNENTLYNKNQYNGIFLCLESLNEYFFLTLWVMLWKVDRIYILCFFSIQDIKRDDWMARFRVNLHSIVAGNVKERFAQNRRDIWSLSYSNRIWIHNDLVRKRTLNHLAKLAKWLSCVVSFYLYGAFDCMLLSCHVRVLKWIYTL